MTTNNEKECVQCGWVGPVVTDDVFLSQEAKSTLKPLGVMFIADAFNEEIKGDSTENWECSPCWWQGWWDI